MRTMIRTFSPYYLLFLITFLLFSCGGGSSSSNNSGTAGTSGSTISTADFINKKLSYHGDFSGSDESDYYFYANGHVDYVSRTQSGHTPKISMKWVLEGKSIFINTGSRFLGSGNKSPRELKFTGRPARNQAIMVKWNRGTFQRFVIIVYENIADQQSVNLSEADFNGKTLKYSIEGRQGRRDISTVTYYNGGTGVYNNGGSYTKDTIWSIVDSNTVRFETDVNDTNYARHTDITFRKMPPEIGDEIEVTTDSLVSGSRTQTYVVVGFN